VELRELLVEHPELDVDEYKDTRGWRALYVACQNGHTECAQLLIDQNADVNATDISGRSALYGAADVGDLGCVKLLVQNGADVNCQSYDNGWTPLITSTFNGHLTTAHYLLDHKADVHYRVSKEGNWKNQDALHNAMRKTATYRTPGIAFAVLSCNTDAKNVHIKYSITDAVRDAHIETYQHVQTFIDEYHSILNRVLSEQVPVDPRFGLGQMGIYQEPLERTLEYLGLSMNKDQVVNASIDGEEGGVKRALIPGHLLNANHWFDKFEKERLRVQLREELAEFNREHEAKIAALFP
jgi:hypothetical protein